MKTAFPEHDRNRYCIIDATEYEEHYATYFEQKVKQPPNDPVYICRRKIGRTAGTFDWAGHR